MGLSALRPYRADRYVKKVDCAQLAAAIAKRPGESLPETVRLRNKELHLGYGEMALSPIPLRDIHS